jgi:hypothetical protein
MGVYHNSDLIFYIFRKNMSVLWEFDKGTYFGENIDDFNDFVFVDNKVNFF